MTKGEMAIPETVFHHLGWAQAHDPSVENISRKGPLNRRFLRSGRDDKGEVIALFLWRGHRLGACPSPLKSNIDRTFADWSRTMTNASMNRDQMPRQELDRVIIKIDEQAAFECQKHLVRIRMTVPMVSLGHNAYTNFVIVNISNGMVVVALRC